ncbi:MAG: alpha/beta fold hydrolase [Candidatus Promineofilum sp.]|nr:alpha/beta fold hydrolase [Promineifilum sp.]
MTSTVGTAALNSTTFAYETSGAGRPLVFIHAGIADSRMWDGQFSALADSFMVVRYDMRGFGRTPPAEGPYAHHDDLAALLTHLGLGRVSLVGCSMGSKTALDFALDHPERVDRLILTSPAVSGLSFDGPRPRQAAELDAAEEAGDLARVNELEMQVWVDGPQRTPDQVAPAVRELAGQMNAIALANEGIGDERPLQPAAAERLGDVRAPTLIVVGAVDAPRTLAAAERLATELPDARKIVMSGAAHLPNMEQPEAYNRHLRAFLGGEEGVGE